MIRGEIFDAFGDSEITQALVGVGRDSDAPNSRAQDVFAGAVWSCLVEPGDAIGGLMRTAFGPAGGLAALDLEDAEIVRRLARAGVADISTKDLLAARHRWSPRQTTTCIWTAFRFAATIGVKLIVPGDAAWPSGLDDLGAHAPAALWARGHSSALGAGPSVALVGSRAASGYGEAAAAELADGLVNRGAAVHSGGAYGVDGMAHRAALAAGGTTVAVMAGGVDRYYPPGHHDLLTTVAERGAVVGEMACGSAPSRWRFLQRNRLIAAMTAATVVVEAGHRSGALNTATHARALDRPVGAVPGQISSPSSAGCHRLLREPGVTCVTGADDILQMIEPTLLHDDWTPAAGRDAPEERRLLDALARRRARTEGELAALSGLGEPVVRATLAVLELTGRAAEIDGGWVRRD